VDGSSRADLGRAGETAAEAFLVDAGMRLVERDVRLRNGQIDLVMLDGRSLVVVEVKSRRGGDYGPPQEAVTRRKLAKLRELAQTYRSLHPRLGSGLRIDVVAVDMDWTGAARGFVHLRSVGLD
jgi:putative endonuclease